MFGKVGLAILAGALAAYPATYNVIDLGTLGGNMSRSYGLNSNGDVVGIASLSDGTTTSFLRQFGTSMVDLGSLGGSVPGVKGEAYGINDSGFVTGWSFIAGNQPRGYIYNPNTGTMSELGTLGGPQSYAYSINGNGDVAGIVSSNGSTYRSGLYTGGAWNMISQPGWLYSEGWAVNNSLQVAGWFVQSGGQPQAFVYSHGTGTITPLGTLGGSTSEPRGINNSGQIVGWAAQGDGSLRAFMFNGGPLQDLGTIGGRSETRAYGINDLGDVVGLATNGSESSKIAFLYTGGVMTDLNTLIDPASGWVLRSAADINDSGMIAGYGEINGETHAFLLVPGGGDPTAVPEPGTIGLMTLGALGLVVSILRKRKRTHA
jgi:probable HAF family extracellular repeat protein